MKYETVRDYVEKYGFEKKTTTAEDCWKSYPYKDKLPGRTNADKKRMFKSICKTTNLLIMKFIIESGYGIKFPSRLGRMVIIKRKSKIKFFDYRYYQLTGEKRWFDNKHSDGYYAKFQWIKRPPFSLLKYSSQIKFLPTKSMKGMLAKAIKDDGTINLYYED